MYMDNIQIKDGEYTKTIYTMIKDERYSDAIKILNSITDVQTTQAGLSLLGHCYYQSQDYVEAANCYEQLLEIVPEKYEYKLYYAQSLFQAGLYEESLKVTTQINNADLRNQVAQLQSAIRYAQEDYARAQSIVATRPDDNPDTLNDEGCLLYQAERYDDALERFLSALQSGGYKATTAYNAALCHYRKREHATALNYIADIIERGIRAHPELGIGVQAEVDGARCVGNPPALHGSGLAQALNLKAAIEFREGNMEAAREAILDLPPRSEPELDPVTLHNMALTNGGPEGLRRLGYLLSLGPPGCPPETLANLLITCCKYQLYDMAADVLAENAGLTYKYLTSYLYDLVDALICSQTAPGDAATKLETLGAVLTARLRALTVRVEEARTEGDQGALHAAVKDYEEALEQYLPVAMAQAWLPWNTGDWEDAEREFRSSAEFCSESPQWKLLAAHVLFMSGDKYKEAAGFYEPIVRANYDDILSVSAAVLANLCVSYIMTSQNEEAEELMRKVEREEERRGQGAEPLLHLCIVNLVIGTLYCSKGNYEFGLSRVARAIEGGPSSGSLATPVGAVGGQAGSGRLCADTWLHAKRCVLGLCSGMAKQVIVLPTAAVKETIAFLENCELYGKRIRSVLSNSLEVDWTSEGQMGPADIAQQTVAYEARVLRALLIKLQNN